MGFRDPIDAPPLPKPYDLDKFGLDEFDELDRLLLIAEGTARRETATDNPVR